MQIKILIDSISLLSPLSGIGRYTYEISKRLQKDDDFEINFFYGYYSSKLFKPSEKSAIKHLKSFIIQSQLIKKLVRKLLFTCSSVFAPTYDIYWQPNFIPNKNIKSKIIITAVHDFSFILYREFHPKERIEYLEKNFYQNISRSDIIITGSHFTKQEIIHRVNIDADKIKVIYHGIDHTLFKIRDNLELDYTLPKKFIFCVGSIEPRKNLLGLLKAYQLLDTSIKKEYKLVLAGFKGWQNKEIMEIINNNKNNIHYLGHISDIELSKTYNLASIFVYPSFYEGFGLPPLEAMACGTPVIASNKSSIPEVCGDAVLYVDPYNIDDIANKMKTLIVDEDLKKILASKGLKKAKEYSWDKSTAEHIKIMKEFI